MLTMIGLTADLREAMSRGIIPVAGEVEGERLAKIVEDVLRQRPEPLYNFLKPTPDLSHIPTPRLTKDNLKGLKSITRSPAHTQGRMLTTSGNDGIVMSGIR